MNKIYVYAFIGILFVGLIWQSYKRGYSAGVADEQKQYIEQKYNQEKAIYEANKKILDLQKRISYNNDECFNRVWPEDVVRIVNELR